MTLLYCPSGCLHPHPLFLSSPNSPRPFSCPSAASGPHTLTPPRCLATLPPWTASLLRPQLFSTNTQLPSRPAAPRLRCPDPRPQHSSRTSITGLVQRYFVDNFAFTTWRSLWLSCVFLILVAGTEVSWGGILVIFVCVFSLNIKENVKCLLLVFLISFMILRLSRDIIYGFQDNYFFLLQFFFSFWQCIERTSLIYFFL